MAMPMREPENNTKTASVLRQSLVDFRGRCPGIIGSLVLSDTGRPIERELPAFFEPNLDQFTDQVMDMYLALKMVIRQSVKIVPANEHDLVLRFDSIVVCCRVLDNGFLVLLAESGCNLTTVNALSNLLKMKVTAFLAERRGIA